MFEKLNNLKNILKKISIDSSNDVLDIINKFAKPECPKAAENTEDGKRLNKKNKESCKENHMYGPENPNEESGKFWKEISEKWDISVNTAKKRKCGNCVAYDESPRMNKCMGTSEGNIGYCWMHHFKCMSERTCATWAGDGPIKEDTATYDWQEKNKSDK